MIIRALKKRTRNLRALRKIALNIIKSVRFFYNINLKLSKYIHEYKKRIRKIFKTINTNQTKFMLENQT